MPRRTWRWTPPGRPCPPRSGRRSPPTWPGLLELEFLLFRHGRIPWRLLVDLKKRRAFVLGLGLSRGAARGRMGTVPRFRGGNRGRSRSPPCSGCCRRRLHEEALALVYVADAADDSPAFVAGEAVAAIQDAAVGHGLQLPLVGVHLLAHEAEAVERRGGLEATGPLGQGVAGAFAARPQCPGDAVREAIESRRGLLVEARGVECGEAARRPASSRPRVPAPGRRGPGAGEPRVSSSSCIAVRTRWDGSRKTCARRTPSSSARPWRRRSRSRRASRPWSSRTRRSTSRRSGTANSAARWAWGPARRPPCRPPSRPPRDPRRRRRACGRRRSRGRRPPR